MSKIDDLIVKYCPNGVEFAPLNTLLDYAQPTKYIVESTRYDEDFSTPVLTAGDSFRLGHTNETSGIYDARKDNPVVIFDDFTTSFHWVDFNFKIKSSAMKIITPRGGVNFKYVYYAMKNIQYTPSSHARHWISKYSNFEIPLPHPEIQEEIVDILDKFTKLEAELEAELEIRRKQYTYYRDELLNFDENEVSYLPMGKIGDLVAKHCPDGVKYREVQEIFQIKNGYTPSKSNKNFWTNGTVPWFRMDDIRKNGTILSESLQQITKDAVKGRRLFPANSIIIATSATIGEHALITVPHLSNQRFTSLSLKPAFAKQIDMRFVYYYCFILDNWCLANTTKSSFSSVNMAGFKRFKFPIPPLPVQKEIVAILDKFDTLVNDISIGLPAEITARRQQYEHYRNRLLTFQEAT